MVISILFFKTLHAGMPEIYQLLTDILSLLSIPSVHTP